MKILQLVHGAPPDRRGGVENSTRELSLALGERHAIRTLTFDARRSWKAGMTVETDRDGPVTLHRLPWPSRKPARRDPAPVRAALAALLEDRPDLVVVQHFMRFPKDLLAPVRDRGLPIVVHLHDLWWICPTWRLLDHNLEPCSGPEPSRCLRCVAGPVGALEAWRRKPRFRRRAEEHRRLLNAADRLVANSAWTLERHREFGVTTAADVVAPIFPRPELLALRDRPRERRSGPLRVGFVGRLQVIKGGRELLAAVRRRPEVILDVHGPVDPDLSAEAEAAAAESEGRVRLHGPYEPAELPEILAGLDLVASPTRFPEPYGLVVDEARMAGVPVLATSLGGVAERVRDGAEGLLVEPGSADAIAARLAEAAERRAELSERARSASPPDAAGTAARIEAIWAEVAGA